MSPLKFITISELKHDAKKILAEVDKTGEKFVVTLNGKPIAVIGPAREKDFSHEGKYPTEEIQYAKHLIAQVKTKLKQEKTQDKPKKK